MDEQKIPPAAYRDSNAIEMLRVWIAERSMHCSIRVGFHKDVMGMEEEHAWGIMVSDLIRHLADAIHLQYGTDKDEVVRRIFRHMTIEIRDPTSDADGFFLDPSTTN